MNVKLADPNKVYRHPTGAFVLRGNAVADAGAEDSPGYSDIRAKMLGGMLIQTEEAPHANTLPRSASIAYAPPIEPIWRRTGARVRTGPDAGAMTTASAADQGMADESGQVPPPPDQAPPVAVAFTTRAVPATAQATIQQVQMQGAPAGGASSQTSGDGSADTDNAGAPVETTADDSLTTPNAADQTGGRNPRRTKPPTNPPPDDAPDGTDSTPDDAPPATP
jgi:hypothetical protein